MEIELPPALDPTISISPMPVLEHCYLDVDDGEAVLHLLDIDEDEPYMIKVPEESLACLRLAVEQIQEMYLGEAS